jgi:phospholipase C
MGRCGRSDVVRGAGLAGSCLLALAWPACGSGTSGRGGDPAAVCKANPGDLSSSDGQNMPIQYIFVLMQENRSFDSYFGRFKSYLQDVRRVNDARTARYDVKSGSGGVDVPGKPYELRDACDRSQQDKLLDGSYDPRVDAPFNPTKPGEDPRSAADKHYWRHAQPGGLEQCVSDTCHEWWCSHLAWDSGRMDGFYAGNDRYYEGGEPIVPDSLLSGERAMLYYDQSDIPFYYWLADQFGLGDHYYASLLGPTWPNRDFLYAATSRGLTSNSTVDLGPLYAGDKDASPPVRRLGDKPDGTPINTIYEALDEAGVGHTHWVRERYQVRLAKWGTWYGGFHAVAGGPRVSNYDDLDGSGGLGFYVHAEQELLAKAKTEHDPLTIVPQGALDRVNFIDPDYLEDVNAEDEHPPGVPQMGQRYVYDVVRILMANPEVWKRSVLFITYDEGGGFYDHVPPPKACGPDMKSPLWTGFYPAADAHYGGNFDRYGFRVPLLVVSPWANRGFVSHVTNDHTSIMRFIEARFGLPALTVRDANANPLLEFFDFSNAREKLAGNAATADRSAWGGEVLPLTFPTGPDTTVPATDVQWFGGAPGEKYSMQAYAPCLAAMPPATIFSTGPDPRPLGAKVWEGGDWSLAKTRPASYSADTSRPFPTSSGRGRGDAACGMPPLDGGGSSGGRTCRDKGFCGSLSLCPPGKFYCSTSSKCFDTAAAALEDCAELYCRACEEPPVPWCGSDECKACAAAGGGLWWCPTDKTCTNLLNDYAIASCPVQRCTCRN